MSRNNKKGIFLTISISLKYGKIINPGKIKSHRTHNRCLEK